LLRRLDDDPEQSLRDVEAGVVRGSGRDLELITLVNAGGATRADFGRYPRLGRGARAPAVCRGGDGVRALVVAGIGALDLAVGVRHLGCAAVRERSTLVRAVTLTNLARHRRARHRVVRWRGVGDRD